MSLRHRIESANWTAPDRVVIGGAEFALLRLRHEPPPPPVFSVLKPREYLDAYVDVLDGEPIKRIFELGILLGGSAAFLTTLFEPERLSCLDLCDPVEALEDFRAQHRLGERVRAHYRTAQDDETRLEAICQEDFDGPLDLVIDDASHHYAPSRTSFEVLFPRLRPGGWYVIEDWHWAHARGFKLWRDQPALSNLVFEILMVCAGRPELVAGVRIRGGAAFVQKGETPPSTARIDLSSLYWTQGRPFTLI